MATVPLIRGTRHGCAVELRVAGLCEQEEAHEARRVPGGDGGGGAVAEARSDDRAALSEGRPAGRPTAVSDRRDVAHLLLAAMVLPVRSGCGGSALRHSSMRAFCHLELGRDAIPDETTILNFRHLLEAHGLTKAVFEAVADHLEARGALLRGGTIVDATLIAASPSTKNAAGQRDPEMRSSKKGNQWYFGMKAHIGVDASSGLVHTAGVTSGSVHDATGDGPPDPR